MLIYMDVHRTALSVFQRDTEPGKVVCSPVLPVNNTEYCHKVRRAINTININSTVNTAYSDRRAP